MMNNHNHNYYHYYYYNFNNSTNSTANNEDLTPTRIPIVSASCWTLVAIGFVVGTCAIIFCYIICATSDRVFFFNPRLNFDDNDEEEEIRRADRRLFILSNVYHKKVKWQGENCEHEDISLPYEKIETIRRIMDHNTRISLSDPELCIPHSETHSENNHKFKKKVETSTTTAKPSTSHHHENNLNNKHMKSLRHAMKIQVDRRRNQALLTMLYSPSICPICIESYKSNEEIAWSSNDECPHAFHLECIIQWLMENNDCPMCRKRYLTEERSIVDTSC